MAKVDVTMITKAFTRPRGFNPMVIQYDAIFFSESDLFLHIVDYKDGVKLACSKSSDGSHFTDAENELSPDTETVYKDAAKGGWDGMKSQLDAFLRDRKAEELKANKRKRSRKKKAGAKTNNARPLTPADTATRPATAATPSTKSPVPKRGKTTTVAPATRRAKAATPSTKSPAPKRGKTTYRNVNTPTNRSSHNSASNGDISRILYDENGKLNKKVIDMLENDDDYALIQRKTTRDVRVSAAAKVIAPYFDGNPNEWTNTDSSPIHSDTVTRDANHLQAFLAPLTKGRSDRAASAIIRLLRRSQCSDIKNAVEKDFKKEQTQLSDVVVNGIKHAIKHHTNSKGGTRTLEAETFVKNVVLACVWGTVSEGNSVSVSTSSLCEIIGTSLNQVSIARDTARNIIEGNAKITALERNRRKDYIREMLMPHLFRWISDDEVTRFDSNQSHVSIPDPCDPSKTITVHQRIWRLTIREHQHAEFLKSSYYNEFMNENPFATGVGITVFSECLKKFKKFVTYLKPESCVDEKVSGLEHAMEALHSVLSKSDAKDSLQCYEAGEGEASLDEFMNVLRLRSSHKLVDLVCCAKEEQPDLHIDKEKDCPRMIPFLCTHGKKEVIRQYFKNGKEKKPMEVVRTCKCCGIKKRLGRIIATLKEDEEIKCKAIPVMVWAEARRQGKTKKGKDNTQRELTSTIMTVAELLEGFEKKLEICIPHIQEIRWMKFLQDTDFTKMSPGSILIFTDYAALMALRALETKNSSVDAHAIVANFVVLWNKRVVKVKGKKKGEDGKEVDIEEEVTISNVDVTHYFAETFEKGKKNDHAMHNVCLDDIISEFREKFRALGIELTDAYVWTDNCPNQYSCQQNFIKVASVENRHPGIKIHHRFAVVDNFKGIHDAVGKDPSLTVKELERQNIRSENALMAFANNILHLETFETKWDRFEATNDIRLKNKRKFGLNSRKMKYVVETLEEYERHSAEYPGRILLCDRSIIQDTVTEKGIVGTRQLHEVCSIEPSIPQTLPDNGEVRRWRVVVSCLPCNCIHCNTFVPSVDGEIVNTQCKYLPWRSCKIESLDGYTNLEPTSPVSESEEVYLARQKRIEAMVEGEDPNQTTESNGISVSAVRPSLDIDVLAILDPEKRAIATRLLQIDATPECNLSYNNAYIIQHESLKRLCPRRWLDDGIINGFNKLILRPKLEGRSHIFSSHFMSQLLNTGSSGMEPPNYTYENVQEWSSRIEGGLFNQHKIFLPINHQNVHWLTMCMNMSDKKISLWDSDSQDDADPDDYVIYMNSALRYLGDEYERAYPEEDCKEWLEDWKMEDLSHECPLQENNFDCGLFHLLNLYCLVVEGKLSSESYSQESIDQKEMRKMIAYRLWEASSNRPVV